jgi:hypothetical protein
MTEITTHNSTCPKVAVQWLNEVLCFVSISVVADSFVLRNRQLLVAAKRWLQFEKTKKKQKKNGNRNRKINST